MSRLVGSMVMWAVLGTILAGCAPTFQGDVTLGQRLGFRPDEPSVGVPETDQKACEAYKEFAKYAKQLKEAYRTRTTQNRMWIYVAGITGLAVAAASGALAAATAVAAGTLALLAISGGFTASAFATIDNSELANVYNAGANQIGTALATAETQVIQGSYPASCRPALATLVNAVSEARNTLETARTNSAEGALVRATAGQKALANIVAAQRDANPTQVILNGSITKINNQSAGPVPVPADGIVTLTVMNAQLDTVPANEIKIALGSKELDMADTFPKKTGAFEYEVKVQVPVTPPDGNAKVYTPVLVVGKSKQRVPTAAGLTLNY